MDHSNAPGLMAALSLMIASGAIAAEQKPGEANSPNKSGAKFTISEETTYVTEPLREDGSVDFAAAINQRMRQGVTPKNNACVLLLQAFGRCPAYLDRSLPEQFFNLLEMDPPADDGQYLQSLSDTVPDDTLSEQQESQLYDSSETAMSRPWARSEFPRIAQWIDRNAKPLKHVHAAVERDRYFRPLVVKYGWREKKGPTPLIYVLNPGVAAFREAANLLCARAMLSLHDGNAAAAWKDLIASHQLGRLVGRGPDVIEALVSYSIELRTTNAELAFLRESRLSSAQARRYLATLDALPGITSVTEKLDFCQRCMYLDALQIMAYHPDDAVQLLTGPTDGLAGVCKIINTFSLRPIDWDAAMLSGNDSYDRMVQAFQKGTYTERRKAIRQVSADLKAVSQRLNDSKSLRDLRSSPQQKARLAKVVGELVAALTMPKMENLLIAEYRARQQASNVRTALALSAYHADHGQYPVKLGQLIPRYLDTVPRDRFADGPLRYNRRDGGYLLYSIGSNTRDENGRTFDDTPAGDDLPVKMTVAASECD